MTCCSKAKHTRSGFTLMELLITLTIIGILAGMAYPSYTRYVMRSHRAVAQGALLEIVVQLERYYSEDFTYEGASLEGLGLNSSTEQGRYTLSLSNLGSDTFTATATPTGDQANDTCGTLTINQLMVKTPAGCW